MISTQSELKAVLEIGGADDRVDEAVLVELVDAYQAQRRPQCQTVGLYWALKDADRYDLLRDVKYWTGDKRIPDGEIPDAEQPAEVLTE